MAAVATFHLLRWRSNLAMINALAFDRLRYRRGAQLLFVRVLGTGKGSSTAPGTEWGRTALFCVWQTESAADAFITTQQHRAGLRESWHVKLRGVGGHGAWRGVDVPKLLQPTLVQPTMSDSSSHITASSAGDADTPLAIITRADVRLQAWRIFSAAARVVDRELHASDGLVAVVAVGEAPILRLGTFSVWRNHDAMRNFSTRRPDHVAVVQRTRAEQWYGEEMFVRFVPYWSTGTWDGRDPLRAT
jgi:heme-degrading monooxygenase HmoA